MATANFMEKDQNWQDETTIYWFSIEGADHGTDFEFNGEQYGVAESGVTSAIVDEDGSPITDDDYIAIAVRNTIEITDEMRSE